MDVRIVGVENKTCKLDIILNCTMGTPYPFFDEPFFTWHILLFVVLVLSSSDQP